ncbi:Gfo/Idh/MocA family oxidoreductase [Alsobacter sp. KACC 23698]|uniref:Gfo/Idh/MocA family oxidoreductase n=1 Tax=Alsobacter sp. KACC 23698 TaxID=3149229 RepID=A0AAU7JIW8_9HYPH
MRAALIGAGHIARQHLACLGAMPHVEIEGVCDVSRARAECACERFGAQAPFTDAKAMIRSLKPDVVHVTTPPQFHFDLVMEALAAGAHVIVEKPAALDFKQVLEMAGAARAGGVALVENYNYAFSDACLRIRELIQSGEFGEVTHVDVLLCHDILGPDSPFRDPDLKHPFIDVPGGPIVDFVTHLASLVHAFLGEFRRCETSWTKRADSGLPYDEFRALVETNAGSAHVAFSSNTRPEAFWLRVYGTRMQAVANLFETRLTLSRVESGHKAATAFRNAWKEAGAVRRSAFGTLLMKLDGGPGTYKGVWELIAQTYRRLEAGREPPISGADVIAVNRLATSFRPGGRTG